MYSSEKMSTFSIKSTWDIAKARNEVRKVLLGHNYPPVVSARAIAVVAALGELILSAGAMGSLELQIVLWHGQQSIELNCKIPRPHGEKLSLETTHSQLMRAANAVEIHEGADRVDITVYLTATVAH